jgi:hypothetical protein
MNDLIVVEKIAGWEKLKALVLLRNSIPAAFDSAVYAAGFSSIGTSL